MEPWWKGAVIYQIYPRSFLDTNGDGIGDLAGIHDKLDYVAALGVDAIWLSPIYPSPDRDFGYDVTDLCNVDPKFGTLQEFDALLEAVHAKGMRLILDQVLAHTSDRHPWFEDSVQGGDKKDWYVWADPHEDGTAPNNWLSAFGGPAWAYHPLRRQYYHHKFLREQPKLNLHHPGARKAALDVLRFWLDRGVDGFRLDVANAYLHDQTLTDNPPMPLGERTARHWGHAPRLQRHLHDANRDENAEVLKEIRILVDQYPEAFVFGEFSEEPQLLPKFVGPDVLHSGYTFDFINDTSFAPEIFKTYYDFLTGHPHVWPCVTFSNHDVVRTVTRFGGKDPGEGSDPRLAKLAIALLLCLKGTVLLYQGEELGLDQADIPSRDTIRDPVGDLYFPYFKGRDGARTPMPWHTNQKHLGFTAWEPWLALSPSHTGLAVDGQERAPDSILSFARAALETRRQITALSCGDIVGLQANGNVFSFQRNQGEVCVKCFFNLSREPADIGKLDLAGQVIPALSVGMSEAAACLPGRSSLVLIQV